MINRRTFIRCLPLLAGVPGRLPHFLSATPTKESYRRGVATEINHPPVSFPADEGVPLGLGAFPVPVDAEADILVRLRFPELSPSPDSALYLRLTTAIDFREEKVVRLYLPESGQKIGRLTMKFAHPFQPFQTAVDARWLPDIRRQGIALATERGTTH